MGAEKELPNRALFLDRLEGASETYTIPVGLRLSGRLDVGALAAALCDLIERHESLRTVFPETLGVARQHILAMPEVGFGLERHCVPEALLSGALSGA